MQGKNSQASIPAGDAEGQDMLAIAGDANPHPHPVGNSEDRAAFGERIEKKWNFILNQGERSANTLLRIFWFFFAGVVWNTIPRASGEPGDNGRVYSNPFALLKRLNLKLFFPFPPNFLVEYSEKKRLRKPSKRLLEYAEEYDHIFAPKKKRRSQEPFRKVSVSTLQLKGNKLERNWESITQLRFFQKRHVYF